MNHTLAVVWLPDVAVDEAAAVRARLRGVPGIDRWVLCRTADDGRGLAVFAPLDEEGTGSSAAGLATAFACEAVEPQLYRRRITTDPARAAHYDQAPFLFSVRVFAPPEWQQPIREWLDGEHFERQVSMEGVLWSDGYEPTEGAFHYLNLWAIEDPALIDSPEWVKVRDTPWYESVRPGFQASPLLREIYQVTKEDGSNE